MQYSVASQSFQTFALRGATYGVGFGASVLISRGLGPEGRGEFYLLVIAAATLLSFAKLGLEQANVFLFGTRRLTTDQIFGQNGMVSLAAGGIAALLFFV